MKKRLILLTVLMGMGALLAGPALADVTLLPDPYTIITTKPHPDGTDIDYFWDTSTSTITNYGGGIYERVATLHGDFYAYSAALNDELGYSGFNLNPSDVKDSLILYTHNPASGANLDMLGNTALDFEDPMFSPSGSPDSVFQGYWGQGDQPNGPVLVDDILGYLRTFDLNLTVPVFNFDMNQTGGSGAGDNLYVAGEVFLQYSDGTRYPGATWLFQEGDELGDGIFDDPDLSNFGDPSWVTAVGMLGIGPYFDKHSKLQFEYLVNNNQGRAVDFIGYADGMDLSNYEDLGLEFVAHFKFTGANNGFETLWLTGTFAPEGTPIIPEPTSMALLGIGLAGFIATRRRKTR